MDNGEYVCTAIHFCVFRFCLYVHVMINVDNIVDSHVDVTVHDPTCDDIFKDS